LNPTPRTSLDQTLVLKDGRRLGYAEVGDPAGAPVIYCHGFPASRKESLLVDAAAKRLRARIIAPDRPGYGLSDWKPERTLPDWPADVAELADALGVERFSVLGVSGGGPYGLALVHQLPHRIKGAALVCPLGPVYQAEAVRPMHPPARFGFTSAQRAPWLMHLVYGGLFGPFMRHRPEVALALLTTAMPAADKLTLGRPEIRAVFCASIREALRPGMRGALLDFVLYSRDWGFRLGDIRLPLTFWHGEADATVPLSHSLLLAAAMPAARVIRRPGEGHFSLPINHADEMLKALLEQNNPPPTTGEYS
jgi:pimeloyl-ACP methyl ester carboxylesterase